MLPNMNSQKKEVQTTIGGILKRLKTPTPLTARSESMTWLLPQHALPIWSRRLNRNMEGRRRYDKNNKWHNFNIEIKDRLWSLWGGLHPNAPWFDHLFRGRQAIGCCVVACCAAYAFRRLSDWNAKLLDAIVVNGDKYYRESVEISQRWDHQLGVNDLCMTCDFQDFRFMVQLELVAFGELYTAPVNTSMSLWEALNYFFTRYHYGVLECQGRRLAFGCTSTFDGGYFMYDCNAWSSPVFPDDQGASYLLRCKHVLVLLYCIVLTLDVRKQMVDFRLYNVDIARAPNYDRDQLNEDELEEQERAIKQELIPPQSDKSEVEC